MKNARITDRLIVINDETHNTARGKRYVLQTRNPDGKFAGRRVDITDTVLSLTR